VAEFDVVMEVATDSLTEEAYRVGNFEGTVTLLVEAQARRFFRCNNYHPDQSGGQAVAQHMVWDGACLYESASGLHCLAGSRGSWAEMCHERHTDSVSSAGGWAPPAGAGARGPARCGRHACGEGP